MKRILPLALALLLVSKVFSQCTVTGYTTHDTIVCGESATLSAYGKGQGTALLSENFDNGSFGPGWSASTQAMWNNPCSPGGVNGTTHIWMGNSSPVPRALTTASFNLSSCANAGVTICFDMLFAEQGDASPCEGPDEPDEGVFLQYSTNNGTTWTTIHYFDPNGGYDPQFINWNNWCFPVPVAALTANTRFRWFQDADSGADYDHWGIDNVVIYCNDPTYNIVWQHDNYSHGPVGGVNPNAVAPHNTTTYTVVMSNGSVSCSSSVTIVVKNPTVVVNAGNDTTVCPGTCAQLNATAKVVQKPAKTPTYTNQETATITGTPGFPGFPPLIPATPGTAFLNMDINITNLNLNTVPNGYITSVCIGSLNMLLFAGIEIFDIWLVCPSGDSIRLVKDSTLTGTSLTNTCFVPAGSNIASTSSPYTGNYSPNQSFNGLTGCDANGVWSLHFQAIFSGFSLPTGNFNSWSISFNDPEVSYVGNFNWSPTTNMTGSNTLTPTVCPPPNSYTLTMSDTAGCVTASDVVNVTTGSCCALSATATVTQPSCAQSNGAINITPVPAGSYTYLWSNGSTQQNLSGLAAGTYTVTITSTSTPTCTFDTTITLNSNSSLTASLTNPVNPTCAGWDGQITAGLSGGTAPFTVTIDTGGTPQSFTLPFAASQTLTNLPAGTINVSVVDAQGCTANATATLTAPANCCTLSATASVTQPSCAQSNGAINISPQPAASYTYLWSNGSTQQNLSGLAAGTYTVTITSTSTPTCTFDTTITLNSNSSLTASLTNPVNPTCAGWDGQITAGLSGGTAPFTVTIDTGGTPQSFTLPFAISQTLTNLPAGTINVSVVDAQGCTASATATLTAPANCCTFTYSANVVQPACGQTNGSITLTVANGSGNYSYNWSNGATTNAISTLSAGSYSVTITDNAYANCTQDTTINLSNPNAPVVNGVNTTDETCVGNDGTATINASGGTGTLTYLWSNSQTNATATGLAAGTYNFTVTDANNCQATGNATVVLDCITCNLATTASVVPPACGQTSGTVTVSITTAGTTPYTYSIDGGSNFQQSNTFNGVAAGNYSVITLDANQCSDTVAVTMPQGGANLNVSVTTTNVSCFGTNNGTATAVSNNGNSPFTYLWSNAQTVSSLTALTPGNYSVTVTDNGGCTGSASAVVTQPSPLAVNLGNDVTVCQGSTVQLSAGNNYATYDWSSGETTSSVSVTIGGSYSVTVTDTSGCTATDAINVTVIPTPTVDLGDDKVTYEGSNVGLFANVAGNPTGGTYNWQPDTLLSCNNCQNTVAFAYDTITYTLTYTDPNGCSSSDNLTLYVLPVSQVFFPNAFTPNGDGNNDIYYSYGGSIKYIALTIFNRWGEKVFDSNNQFVGWDGNYKGKPQPPGVYVYLAKVVLLNDEERNFTGSLTLIR